MTKWFLNEDWNPYPYDPALQQEHFPNDPPDVFDSEQEAIDKAEEWDEREGRRWQATEDSKWAMFWE